jgi:hypothetical protein
MRRRKGVPGVLGFQIGRAAKISVWVAQRFSAAKQCRISRGALAPEVERILINPSAAEAGHLGRLNRSAKGAAPPKSSGHRNVMENRVAVDDVEAGPGWNLSDGESATTDRNPTQGKLERAGVVQLSFFERWGCQEPIPLGIYGFCRR